MVWVEGWAVFNVFSIFIVACYCILHEYTEVFIENDGASVEIVTFLFLSTLNNGVQCVGC